MSKWLSWLLKKFLYFYLWASEDNGLCKCAGVLLMQSSISPSRNTLLFTPERDKQPTCGISFRGLLDPKK